jgi:hypothetical protein
VRPKGLKGTLVTLVQAFINGYPALWNLVGFFFQEILSIKSWKFTDKLFSKMENTLISIKYLLAITDIQ